MFSEINCKFCGKSKYEAYPPSVGLTEIVKNPDGTDLIDKEGNREMTVLKWVVDDLCTECYREMRDRFYEVREDKEKYQQWKQELTAKADKIYRGWAPDAFSFTDNLFGTGCPCLFVFTKNTPPDFEE